MLIETGYAIGAIMEAVKVVAAACELIDHLKGDNEKGETPVEDPKEK